MRFPPISLGVTIALAIAFPLIHSQAQTPSQNPKVVVDDDGTAHVPPQAIPLSPYLSPEGKAYVTEHLKDMQNPEKLVQDNGVPRFMKRYLERQKALYPVDREDTKIAGVHAYVYTPKAGISPSNQNRVSDQSSRRRLFRMLACLRRVRVHAHRGPGKVRVISLDYREGPEYKFPAASEDVAAVYQEMLKDHKPENIGIYGCSAGGC